jgi:protein-glucosylgalactosylhydroxylysine glucosidase
MQLKEIGILLILVISTSAYTQINRKALVERHKVIVHEFDSMSSLSVGNGNFAATVDATG